MVAQLQLAATYIGDSHTVQMYNYSSKGPIDNCKAILAKMKARRILTLFNAHHQD